MLENFLVGVASSFSAGLVVIVFLFAYLKPKISISPEIAKRIDSKGNNVYTFKIINNTAYAVNDIRVELSLCTPRNIPNGQINDKRVLESAHTFELDSYKNQTEPFGNEAYYSYIGLENIWNDDSQYVMFKLISRHSLSQFSKVETKKYFRKGACIKLGQFNNGPSLDVVSNG